jgi:amino acid adenylation domain-containing protein
LPLDPANPDHRLKYMVQDSQAEFVLTCAETALRFHRWPLRQLCMDGDRAAIRHAPDTAPKRPKLDLAYVVYTSGSTGEPKGVLGTQKGALNRCRWMWERYPFAPDEVCAQQTTLGFVDAVWEVFGPLLRGVPLALVRDDEVRDPERLVASLQQHRVTRITVVPSLLRVLLNGSESLGKRLPRLRYCSCSGETLTPDLAKQFRQQAADAVLLNLYGCSEAAADSCCFEVPRELNLDRVPIGRPIANTRVFILDKYQQPVPPGAQGEICIAGDGLAAGYLNRPGLTAERFTFTQLPGAERVYRTGDLGRFRGDGNIEYMGRADHQVKIRGNRVEIGEVEAALNSHPDVIQAALQDVLDSSGDRALVAYVISRGQPQHGNLRSYLARRLPAYMLPSRFVELTAMPLTASGKLDRQRLSMTSPRDTAVPQTAPRDEMEQRLLRIWGQTLGISHLGVEDDFFDWGGHSLLAAQLASALAKEFGQRFPVSLVFRLPTVALFAAHLRGDLGTDARHNLIAVQREGLKPPLFWIPGGAGSLAFSRLRPLARLLGPDQPFYGLGTKRAQTLAEVETISERAGEYAALIQALQPRGPYYIAGFCLGGTVAFELARQLQTSGEEVAFLAMMNTWMPARSIPARQWLAIYAERALYHLRLRQTMKNRGANGYFRSKVRSLAQELRSEIAKGNGTVEEQPAEILSDARVLEATVRAASAYVPEYFEGKLHLFLAEEPGLEGVSLRLDPRRAWQRVCRDCEVIPLLGGHDEMLDPPLVEIFGERFQRLLSSAQAGSAKTVAATGATSALPSRGSRISKAARRS